MDVKGVKKDQLLDFYSTMYSIRRFEEEVFELYKVGLMPGLAHLYIGEEAVATGACSAISEGDYIGSHHRGHGHLIASGADLNRMMAEILGKKDGYCRGKGGSMHIMALDKGIIGANGIVGGGIPIATGAAYTCKLKQNNKVVLCFLGDASSNEGTFHESINMASAWNLPIVYIIENNLYGISVDIRKVTNVKDLSVRAKGYGIPGYTVDGNNVIEVNKAVVKAVKRARKGDGPTLIECKTFRSGGHHVGDPAKYRSAGECEMWKNRCPIVSLKKALLEESVATKDEISTLENSVEERIKAAVSFAKEAEYPDPEAAFEDVFAN